jgi:predicted nucleic acid-binding protein
MGTLTTMFLRDDVEVLAELAKGDLTGHLKKRKKSREERETAAQELRALTAERHARRVAAGMEKAVVAARQGVSLRDVVVVADDEEVQVFEEYSRDEDLMFGEVAVVEDD